MTLSGNASINIAGGVYVDSSSSSALSASGTPRSGRPSSTCTAASRRAATRASAPTGHRAARSRPARLAAVAEHHRTDQPRIREPRREFVRDDQAGHLCQISVSGNASLTMSGGTYIIEGGGFSGLGQRQRHRLGGDDRQRRQRVPELGRDLRQHQLERQRLV